LSGAGRTFFVSAGTFDYWQAWLWLLIFFGCGLRITIFLIKNEMDSLQRKLLPGPGSEREWVQKNVPVARIIFPFIQALPGFDHGFS